MLADGRDRHFGFTGNGNRNNKIAGGGILVVNTAVGISGADVRTGQRFASAGQKLPGWRRRSKIKIRRLRHLCIRMNGYRTGGLRNGDTLLVGAKAE